MDLKWWLKLFPDDGASKYGPIYLLQLIIPACFLFELPWQRALLGAVMLILYGCVYVYSFWPHRYGNFIALALELILMWAMVWWLSPGYFWMVYYPTALIALNRSQRFLWTGLTMMFGGSLVVLVAWVYVHHAEAAMRTNWAFIPVMLFGVFSALFGIRMQSRIVESREQIRRANDQIERLTKHAERARISQDLHDLLGHDLTLITLKAQLAGRLVSRDAKHAETELHEIERASRRALMRVREYIADMRQPTLEEEWNDAIRLLQAANIRCQTRNEGVDLALATPPIRALAMALREATTNIVRHSHAGAVTVELWAEGGEIACLVIDDGDGLTKHTGSKLGPDHVSGLGMSGMTKRLTAVQGQFQVWSPPGQIPPSLVKRSLNTLPATGTVVYFRVPQLWTWPETAEEVSG